LFCDLAEVLKAALLAETFDITAEKFANKIPLSTLILAALERWMMPDMKFG
jgi:hypothetical protein